MRLFCVVLTFNFVFVAIHGNISTSIPSHLLKCYQSDYTGNFTNPPMTIRVFIELIRKLESDEGNTLNMRVLSSAILHGLRLDGIRRSETSLVSPYVVPYRASGPQFYKYKLLTEYLTSGEELLIPYDALTLSEQCLLHQMISSTVDDRLRGDERQTCLQTISESNYQTSGCPIEKGVVDTRWGTVSPGLIIAAIASSLQSTDVGFQQIVNALHEKKNGTDGAVVYSNIAQQRTVNNVWASTIAGDLGEVVVLQAMNDPVIDVAGYWNDSNLQSIHYLNDTVYDFTRSELLGGIDGLILAKKIREWRSSLSRTRLSQVLDMYYSPRGVAFNTSYKACERKKMVEEVFNDTNDLLEQTSDIAKLLQELGLATRFLYEETIDNYSSTVVQKFLKNYGNTLKDFSECGSNSGFSSSLEIVAVFDETWDEYQLTRLVALLVDEADISVYGNKLGLIYGQNGTWMTKITGSTLQLFRSLQHNNFPRVTSLTLHRSLWTISRLLQNRTYSKCKSVGPKPRGFAIVLFTPTALLTDNDFRQSSLSLSTIKGGHPEVKIVYVTSIQNSASYQALANSYSEDVVVVLQEPTTDIKTVVTLVSEKLRDVPGHIVDFYCNETRVALEDYVTPERNTVYEIQYEYLRLGNFFVQFKGNDYGDLSVCAYDSKSEDKTCKNITEYNEVNFTANEHCHTSLCDVRFSVTTINSKIKCSELDCRYPDQIRINIFSSWTSSSGLLGFSHTLLFCIIFFTAIK